MVTASGSTSKWFKIEVLEGSNLPNDLTFTTSLVVPPGMVYDLYVYSGDASAPDCFSMPFDGTGDPLQVALTWPDSFGSDDSLFFAIEVRYVSGFNCTEQWTLTVQGHT